MLNIDELIEVESLISNNLTYILSRLNQEDRIEELLELLEVSYIKPREDEYIPYKSGNIIVAGGSKVKRNVLESIGKELNIDKNRFEFCLDYEEASKFNFKKTQYNPNYSLVIFGPIPHSGPAKEKYASIITAVQNVEGYPRCILLGENELKISKTNFRKALESALEEGIIK